MANFFLKKIFYNTTDNKDERSIIQYLTIGNKIRCQRNFALKNLCDVLPPSEEKTLAFLHPPSPPCNVVPLYKLSVINDKNPNFEWRRWIEGLQIVLLSEEPNLCTVLKNNSARRRLSSGIRLCNNTTF